MAHVRELHLSGRQVRRRASDLLTALAVLVEYCPGVEGSLYLPSVIDPESITTCAVPRYHRNPEQSLRSCPDQVVVI
jgi:hypothetical protein